MRTGDRRCTGSPPPSAGKQKPSRRKPTSRSPYSNEERQPAGRIFPPIAISRPRAFCPATIFRGCRFMPMYLRWEAAAESRLFAARALRCHRRVRSAQPDLSRRPCLSRVQGQAAAQYPSARRQPARDRDFLYMRRMRRTVRTQIKEYLQTYRQARGRRRNHDPLSREFILNMFYAWQVFRYGDDKRRLDPLRPEERRLFARFLVAAWRDAAFPLTDHRGNSREPLENWFADQVPQTVFRPKFPHWPF